MATKAPLKSVAPKSVKPALKSVARIENRIAKLKNTSAREIQEIERLTSLLRADIERVDSW